MLTCETTTLLGGFSPKFDEQAQIWFNFFQRICRRAAVHPHTETYYPEFGQQKKIRGIIGDLNYNIVAEKSGGKNDLRGIITLILRNEVAFVTIKVNLPLPSFSVNSGSFFTVHVEWVQRATIEVEWSDQKNAESLAAIARLYLT